MATALVLTFTMIKGSEGIESVAISNQTLIFVTPQAAEKALAKIKEVNELENEDVSVTGAIVGDVIV